MNPYPDRLNDLHAFLESTFGHKDRQSTDVLLTALLPESVTGYRRPWIIIETDWPSRDCSSAWFSFGLTGDHTIDTNHNGFMVRSLSVPRVQRSQLCEEILQDWLSLRRTSAPGLFVDAEWRRMPTSGRGAVLLMATHSYCVLLTQCIRLRIAHPRGGFGTMPRDEQTKATTELARLARRVLDCSHRPLSRPLPDRRQPASLFYWCELLQRLAPLQTDWETLTGSLTAIATGVGALYGRETVSFDGEVASRLMRDCVPYATRWILESSGLERSKGIKAFQLFKQSGQVADRAIVAEIRRLAREGVLVTRQNYKAMAANDPYGYHPWRYRFGDEDYRKLLDRSERILT